jgi:hypothetical protein
LLGHRFWRSNNVLANHQPSKIPTTYAKPYHLTSNGPMDMMTGSILGKVSKASGCKRYSNVMYPYKCVSFDPARQCSYIMAGSRQSV